MASIHEIMTGMVIMSNHVDVHDGAVEAGHDTIWLVGPGPDTLTEGETMVLKEAGWHWDTDGHWEKST